MAFVGISLIFKCKLCGGRIFGETSTTLAVPMEVDNSDFSPSARRAVVEEFSAGWKARAIGCRSVELVGPAKHGWEAAHMHATTINAIPSVDGWKVVIKDYLDSEDAWLHLSKHESRN
jgi:hypothetical protein